MQESSSMRKGIEKFGALGGWEKIDEQPDTSIVKQINDASCVSAVGEMLARHYGMAVEQAEILEAIGEWSNAEALAEFLNSKEVRDDVKWTGGGWNIETPSGALKWLLRNYKIGAMLFDKSTAGHAVFVDSLDTADLVVIKDPFDQTVYKMTIENYIGVFAFFVWRKEK